jgi:hypothetical protein
MEVHRTVPALSSCPCPHAHTCLRTCSYPSTNSKTRLDRHSSSFFCSPCCCRSGWICRLCCWNIGSTIVYAYLLLKLASNITDFGPERRYVTTHNAHAMCSAPKPCHPSGVGRHAPAIRSHSQHDQQQSPSYKPRAFPGAIV